MIKHTLSVTYASAHPQIQAVYTSLATEYLQNAAHEIACESDYPVTVDVQDGNINRQKLALWDEMVRRLRTLLKHVSEYHPEEYPPLSHPGPCGPESACDVNCMEASIMADHDAAIRRAQAILTKAEAINQKEK